MNELESIKMILCQLIIHYNREQSDIDYFSDHIQDPETDYSLLYQTAELYEQYVFSNLIIQSGKYKINEDKSFVKEIVSCIISSNSNVVMHYIGDGLILNEEDLINILKFYEPLEPSEYEQELYLYFRHLYSLMRIKK